MRRVDQKDLWKTRENVTHASRLERDTYGNILNSTTMIFNTYNSFNTLYFNSYLILYPFREDASYVPWLFFPKLSRSSNLSTDDLTPRSSILSFLNKFVMSRALGETSEFSRMYSRILFFFAPDLRSRSTVSNTSWLSANRLAGYCAYAICESRWECFKSQLVTTTTNFSLSCRHCTHILIYTHEYKGTNTFIEQIVDRHVAIIPCTRTLAPHPMDLTSRPSRLPDPRHLYSPACVHSRVRAYGFHSLVMILTFDLVVRIHLFLSSTEVEERNRKCYSIMLI